MLRFYNSLVEYALIHQLYHFCLIRMGGIELEKEPQISQMPFKFTTKIHIGYSVPTNPIPNLLLSSQSANSKYILLTTGDSTSIL